jgi:ribosomal protein L37AE/L43A
VERGKSLPASGALAILKFAVQGGLMLFSNIAEIGKPLPEPIKRLHDLLEKEYATGLMSFLTINAPLREDGVWHLDFSNKPGAVVIGWMPGQPFGLTNFEFPGMNEEERTVFGEGWKNIAQTPEEAVAKISEMITVRLKGSRGEASLTVPANVDPDDRKCPECSTEMVRTTGGLKCPTCKTVVGPDMQGPACKICGTLTTARPGDSHWKCGNCNTTEAIFPPTE